MGRPSVYIKEQGMEHLRKRNSSYAVFMSRRWKFRISVSMGIFPSKDRAAIVSLNLGEEDSAQVSDYLLRNTY